MGLKIMSGRDGKPRETWYARFTRNGKKVNVNLRVPIRGTIPTTTDDKGHVLFDADGAGDAAFTKSRKAALSALAAMEKAAKRTGDTTAVKQAKTADIARRYYRAREGKSIEAVDTRLADLPKLWRARPRSYTPTVARMEYYDLVFRRFADFAKRFAVEHGGTCTTLNTITPEIATAYFDAIRAEYAWETVKGQMSLLSGAYDTWSTSGEPNPFKAIVKRNREIGAAKVNKRPLSEAELERLFEAAAGDRFLRPLIDCAACTGMRIGDVCNLKWREPITDPDGKIVGYDKIVDLDAGFIDCTTAKAGVRVTIPIFPRLKATLEERAADVDAIGSEYVFPEAAERYNHLNAKGKPDQRMSIIRSVKPLFALAVYGDKPDPEVAQLVDETSAERKTSAEICALIEGSHFAPSKKARVLDTYQRFSKGATYAEITAATGRHKAIVSQDLEAVEDLTGQRIRPGDAGMHHRTTIVSKRALTKRTRTTRGVGKFAASVYGWHSLRTSFVTLALQYGVPIEDVRKIVGHQSVRTTEDYDRASKRHAVERVMRQMTGSALDTPKLPVAPTVDANGKAAVVTIAPGRKSSIDDLLAGLSEQQKKALARKLLGL